MTNKEKDCTDCKHYYTDYDCREFCESRDMFEPKNNSKSQKELKSINEHIKENRTMNEAELRQALIVKELENIKAEIKRAVSDFYMENSDIAYGLTVAECILDKHIKENKQ